MPPSYAIGVDFGTNSVRAVVVDCADGHTAGTSVFEYPSGERGVITDPRDPHLARQHPGDYLVGLRGAVPVEPAARDPRLQLAPARDRPARGGDEMRPRVEYLNPDLEAQGETRKFFSEVARRRYASELDEDDA